MSVPFYIHPMHSSHQTDQDIEPLRTLAVGFLELLLSLSWAGTPNTTNSHVIRSLMRTHEWRHILEYGRRTFPLLYFSSSFFCTLVQLQKSLVWYKSYIHTFHSPDILEIGDVSPPTFSFSDLISHGNIVKRKVLPVLIFWSRTAAPYDTCGGCRD